MKRNRKMLPVAVAIGLVFLAGCTPPGPVLTPLEIQSLQTREFEHDKAVVFASTMSVFQDLGYIVNSADLDTGLITTESPATSDRATFPARLTILPDLMVWSDVTSVVQTKATAFIEQIWQPVQGAAQFRHHPPRLQRTRPDQPARCTNPRCRRLPKRL